MGTERRKEPGSENKLQIAVPGPTKYQLPSLVNFIFTKISGNCRFKRVPESP
jgi:hypothetical protein